MNNSYNRILQDADLRLANLRAHNLRGANLYKDDLTEADLSGADLRMSPALFPNLKIKKKEETKQASSELNRLLMAAVVSERFRHMLLSNPAKAMRSGYGNERFDLTAAERQLVLSIVAKLPSGKARTVQAFAQRLIDQLAEETDEQP